MLSRQSSFPRTPVLAVARLDSLARKQEQLLKAEEIRLQGIEAQATHDFDLARQKFEDVIEVLIDVYGVEHDDVAYAYDTLGLVQFAQGNNRAALASHKKALAIYNACNGKLHASVATCLCYLAEVFKQQQQFVMATKSYQQSLNIWLALDKHPEEVVKTLRNLAFVLREQGNQKAAEEALNQALETGKESLGSSHPEVVSCLSALSTLHVDRREFRVAEQMLHKALEMLESDAANCDSDTASEMESVRDNESTVSDAAPATAALADALSQLAALQEKKNNLRAAEKYYRKALDVIDLVYGECSVEAAEGMEKLALLLTQKGKLEEAQRLQVQATDLLQKYYGEVHPKMANTLLNLALVLSKVGSYEEASAIQADALQRQEKLHGRKHTTVSNTLMAMADVALAENKFADAEGLYHEALAIHRQLHGEFHGDVAACLRSLGLLHVRKGDLGTAEQLYYQALNVYERVEDSQQSLELSATMCSLGVVLHNTGQFEEAEEMLCQAAARYKVLYTEFVYQQPAFGALLEELAMLYKDKGDLSNAEPLLWEAINVYMVVYGDNHEKVQKLMDQVNLLLKSKGDSA